MKVALLFTGRSLEPLEAQDLDELRGAYERGEIVSVDVKKDRNLGHHRKFFAFIRAAVEHGCVLHDNRFHDPEALRAYVEVCIGWCDYYDTPKGRIPVPRTINFDRVDQTMFEKIYQNAVLFMADEIEEPAPDIVAEADELRAKGIERTDLRDAA